MIREQNRSKRKKSKNIADVLLSQSNGRRRGKEGSTTLIHSLVTVYIISSY